MKRYEQYLEEIKVIETQILNDESKAIETVANKMAVTLKNKKQIYLFGCGHSHILVEEAFYRAGGLVPVTPIFDTALMLHDGAVKSSHLEKMEEYGKLVFERINIQKDDMIFIFSNSGINGCPIEIAIRAHERGAVVVVFSSKEYVNKERSRHSSGKYLVDFADYIIDTHVPYGDALVKVNNNRIAPGSTISGALIWNMLISQLSEEEEKLGIEREFFVSGNIEGGAEMNQRYIKKYQTKISSL